MYWPKMAGRFFIVFSASLLIFALYSTNENEYRNINYWFCILAYIGGIVGGFLLLFIKVDPIKVIQFSEGKITILEGYYRIKQEAQLSSIESFLISKGYFHVVKKNGEVTCELFYSDGHEQALKQYLEATTTFPIREE